jgi:hypothetical protein
MKEAGEQIDLGPQQIVVLDRGWVYVGKSREVGDKLVIEDAQCIRYWGTTRGLGELAANGPTGKTKLDPVGRLVAPMRAVISIIACKCIW